MQHSIVDLPEVEYIAGRSYPKVSPKRVHGMVQGRCWGVVVEVRSPSDRDAFVRRKTALHLAHGARVVLNVDPATRTISVDEADGNRRVFSSGERVLTVLAWLSFDVAAVFADLDLPI